MFTDGKKVAAQGAGEGITRKVLSYSKQVMLCELALQKGAAVPTHSHPHEQISYIVKGSCRYTVGEETYAMHAGDSVLMPANVPHSALMLEDCMIVDAFSPMREDFI